jgi:hypothetical protein
MIPRAATRVDRLPAKALPRTVPLGDPKGLGFEERVALFVCALHRERSTELLAGFADAPRKRAEAFAGTVTGWDSSTRQARLTREFGAHTDALDRLQQLIVESPPALRCAIAEQLPEAWRSRFPHLARSPGMPSTPLMAQLAARLVRETVR